jgi:hypothetical protein
MAKGRIFVLGAGIVLLNVVFGGAVSALSSSEILLWERLKSHRLRRPAQIVPVTKLPVVKMPIVTEPKVVRGSGDLSDLLEKLQQEERERRLLDSLLSQIADDLEKEKER